MLPQLRHVYDSLVQYAALGQEALPLAEARKTFIARTGDLFETDAAFERRICAFLEWYTLDHADTHGLTLLQRWSQAPAQSDAALAAADAVSAWQHASLSLFSLAKVRPDGCVLDDLLLSQRYTVPLQPILVGLKAKDILAGRIVVFQAEACLTDGVSFFPNAASRVLLRIAKSYRKGQVPGVSKLDLVHRLIYLTNRCDRYRHVDPKRIFSDGEAQVTQSGATPRNQTRPPEQQAKAAP